MQRLLTGLLGVSLLLAACGDDDADDDRAAVTSIPDETTTSSTTTTEPETVAVDVIPPDTALITEDYVEQVLDALYETALEAFLATRDAGVVEEQAIGLSEAINTSDHAVRAINSLAEIARNGFEGFRAKPTPVDATVIRIHEATADCIFAEASFDTSGLTAHPAETSEGVRTFVRLRAASPEQRAGGNPTAWAIDELPASDDGSVPEPQCSGL